MFRSFNKAKQRNIIYAIVLNVVVCVGVCVFAHVNCFQERIVVLTVHVFVA